MYAASSFHYSILVSQPESTARQRLEPRATPRNITKHFSFQMPVRLKLLNGVTYEKYLKNTSFIEQIQFVATAVQN